MAIINRKLTIGLTIHVLFLIIMIVVSCSTGSTKISYSIREDDSDITNMGIIYSHIGDELSSEYKDDFEQDDKKDNRSSEEQQTVFDKEIISTPIIEEKTYSIQDEKGSAVFTSGEIIIEKQHIKLEESDVGNSFFTEHKTVNAVELDSLSLLEGLDIGNFNKKIQNIVLNNSGQAEEYNSEYAFLSPVIGEAVDCNNSGNVLEPNNNESEKSKSTSLMSNDLETNKDNEPEKSKQANPTSNDLEANKNNGITSNESTKDYNNQRPVESLDSLADANNKVLVVVAIVLLVIVVILYSIVFRRARQVEVQPVEIDLDVFNDSFFINLIASEERNSHSVADEEETESIPVNDHESPEDEE